MKNALAKILHQVEEAVAAQIGAEFPGVPPLYPNQVVGELEGVVLADLAAGRCRCHPGRHSPER